MSQTSGMNVVRPKFPKFTKKRAAPPSPGESLPDANDNSSPLTPLTESPAPSPPTHLSLAHAPSSAPRPLTETAMTRPTGESANNPKPPMIVYELKRTHFGPVPAVCGPWDGKVASKGPLSGFVFTSPTELYVPKVPRDVDIIHTFIDGRWGVNEYSRHPQWYVEDMTHIACIPRRPCAPSVPEVLFDTLDAKAHWEEDSTVSVRGFGRICSQIRSDLFKAANTVIDSTNILKSKDGRALQYRNFLVMLLRQVITRATYLPAVASRAIAVAAHAQRICLELLGLKTYLEVVIPRMESSEDFSRSGLDVLGAFLREGATTQTWHRVGIPYWVLQPLSPQIVVYRVVAEEELPYVLSTSRCDPPILHRGRALVGVSNLTGNWVSHMVLAVSKDVAGSHLSSLDLVCLPTIAEAGECGQKRTRPDAQDIVSRHLKMRPAVAQEAQSKATSRAKPRIGAQPVPATVASHPRGRDIGTNATQMATPSRTFLASPYFDVSELWTGALLAVSPLPQTPNSALYFFPPPFLLDTLAADTVFPPGCPHPDRGRLDTKVNRYVHNMLRIREFCRMRLFDVSLENRPLSISEWRAALWGEYRPQESVQSGGQGSEARWAKRRLEERNAVGALFHKVANMDTYCADAIVQFEGHDFDLQSSSSNLAVRQSLLWECHEVNFRAELLALDTQLVQKKDWPEINRWEREMIVSGVWGPPTCGATVVADTRKDVRLFGWYTPPHESWRSCRDRLRYFALVLTRWPGCPEVVIEAGKRDPDDVHFAEVQREAVHFYVRTFVSQYARLPIPPVESE